MADISQINLPNDNNNPYDIADTTARSGLADKMDKTNPTGTGSFSLNRQSGSSIGTNSFAEGYNTTASGECSHAEGYYSTAIGSYSHAEGRGTDAIGSYSHAEGRSTAAIGSYSHADGYYSTANHRSQHVFGEYNALDDSSAEATARGNYVEIVGNGIDGSSRSNARTLDWSGNEVLSGTIEATGFGTTLDKEVDRGGVQLTQAQYDALVNAGTVDANTTYFITDGQNITTASAVTYDNTNSGMTATDVQGAIDEVNGKAIGDIDDVNLSSPADGDALAYDGTNWVNFDLGAFESASTASANPVTCANSTYTECVHITLNKGVYLFIGMLGFDTNTTGVRGINISAASGDSGIAATRLTVNTCVSGHTRFQTLYVTRVTSNSSIFYLNAWQNSGGNLNVIYSRLLAVKIGK